MSIGELLLPSQGKETAQTKETVLWIKDRELEKETCEIKEEHVYQNLS